VVLQVLLEILELELRDHDALIFKLIFGGGVGICSAMAMDANIEV